MKEVWKRPEFVKLQMQARGVTQNKAEIALEELIAPFGFQFVGDGKLVVDGKVPDFWDGGTRLVEMYGDYWHRGANSAERVYFFRERGYDCIVIWESELKSKDLIVDKVRSFIGG